ncbi:hydroxydechloroatrazine ethylaminohydrolase [Stappia aggregata IAM 12614]|uniref:Hydroxydechloroatrazine ethylaminohydrolase n=1 Tax=Roseibium aggregatum (strain ATCC 25650 / DSM 13394 / JCM 20685 / NBRC 16684 / NCIMB 2208 / IAM 12614 / B1) TaxID=384765 RepID=A0P3R3_ROSAI|nr:amidohydrolase family protein [Roseibium aggregatum]EAV40319.1 hydroxydechloroatrazine ethylaminohydrolase [Stappia aggregata IAM 12614] [Roseibium aggregatum IAM 12614]
MTSFLITNIDYGLTGNREGDRLSGAIRVQDGRITDIGDLQPQEGERIVDASGCVVTPGLVNTHHHLFQSVLKAVPEGMNAPLDDWLMNVPYSYWPLIDEETLRISARIGLAELLLTGTTTVCDHHYVFSDRYDYDPANVLFEEAEALGIRFVLARGGGTKGRSFPDPSLPPSPSETLDAFLASIEQTASRWHDPSPTSSRRVAVAPTTPTFNLEAGDLPDIARFARSKGLRLHSHLSENRTYVDFTLAKYGKRPVHWLAEQEWLGPDVWFAHLVECDPDEVRLLAETGTGMAHCPQANARLGSGIAPADCLYQAGGHISLAVDGAGANEAADMGAALYSAFSLHRATKGVQAVRAETLLNWATEGGAKVLGFEEAGVLQPGMTADIAIFDISSPRNMGLHDPALAPVLTGAASLRHSFVGGRQIVRDGSIPGLDLAGLGADARRVTRQLMERRKDMLAPNRARAALA